MNITILGSGTLVPSLTRNPSGTIIELKDNLILFDCGSGTLRQLLNTRYDYKEIDTVLISHFHTDNINDLVYS